MAAQAQAKRSTASSGRGLRQRRARTDTAASVFGLVLLGTVLLANSTGCGVAAPGLGASFGSRPPAVEASNAVLALERRMYERVNQDRAAEKLPALVYDERLAAIGRAHALDMQTGGFFSHESPTTGRLEDRLHVAGYLAAEARENLASAPDVDRAEDNLLRSPGHRANLFATSITHVGIGIVTDASQPGQPMLTITQLFSRPAAPSSAEEVAAAVVETIAQARRSASMPSIERDPMLDQLARAHLEQVPLDLGQSALANIGREVATELARQPGHGLTAVDVVAQILTEAGDFELPASVRRANAKRIGLAAVAVTEESGRPQVKLLALVGL